MLAFPNCKINIGLFVTGRRDDGYHNLETVFYPLPWRDVLEAVPAADFSLSVTGIAVQGNAESNLVSKAFLLLRQYFPDRMKPLAFYLHKVLPMGAGLGGGSADGAFALKLINELCALHLNDSALEDFALQLGSDCPFFIRNQPAFASGRGERLEPVHLSLAPYSVQVVCPGIHISTAAAFAGITPRPAPFDLKTLPDIPVKNWNDLAVNYFEEPVFAAHPELKKIKDDLNAAGALYASMSGSGSALFGIFEKGRRANILGYETFYVE